MGYQCLKDQRSVVLFTEEGHELVRLEVQREKHYGLTGVLFKIHVIEYQPLM